MRALAARLAGRRVTGLVQRRADIRFPLPAAAGPAPRGPDRARASPGGPSSSSASSTTARSCCCIWACPAGCVFDGEPCGPHEHLTFAFDDGTLLRFVDPRRFGMVDLWPAATLAEHRWLAHLGLEPLDAGFDGRGLAAALAGRRTALKVALMDQRLVVGVGNIYASESLFRARLDPSRAGRQPGAARGAAAGAVDPRRCCARRSRPAAPRCATTSSPTASSATSSAAFASTTGRASPAWSAAGRSGASSRARGRPSCAAPASADGPPMRLDGSPTRGV